MFELRTNPIEYIVAGNAKTSANILEKLGRSTSTAVRARVAENPNIPIDLQLKLLKDENAEVRLGLSYNPMLPSHFIVRLAADENPDVRLSLAGNPNLSCSILHMLEKDENPYVVHAEFCGSKQLVVGLEFKSKVSNFCNLDLLGFERIFQAVDFSSFRNSRDHFLLFQASTAQPTLSVSPCFPL